MYVSECFPDCDYTPAIVLSAEEHDFCKVGYIEAPLGDQVAIFCDTNP